MNTLANGTSFALVAPASFANPEKTKTGIAFLKSQGYHDLYSPQLFEQYNGYGGSIAQRVEMIHQDFLNPKADAILCMREGYGNIQLLEHLDYDLIAQHPKPFIGYSDITSLHMAFIARSGLCTIHGAMLASDMTSKPPLSSTLLLDMLTDSWTLPPFKVLKAGKAWGILLGGNLTVFMSSLGTPYMPSLKGCLLFLEEIGEAAYRIDHMLRTLKLSGILSQCAGLLFGQFLEHPAAQPDPEYQDYIHQTLSEICHDLNISLVYDLPCEHGEPNYPLPLGTEISLCT